MLTKLAVRQGVSNPWPRVQFGPTNPRHVAKEERDVNFYFEPEASCSNILFVELIVFGIIWFVIFSSTTVTVLIFNRNFLQKCLWLFCIQTSNTDMTIQLNVWGGGQQQWWPPAHLGLTPLQFNHSARRWQWHNNGLLILSSLSPIGRSRSQQTSGEVRLDPGLFSSPPTGHR